jgi:hypothetical protein
MHRKRGRDKWNEYDKRAGIMFTLTQKCSEDVLLLLLLLLLFLYCFYFSNSHIYIKHTHIHVKREKINGQKKKRRKHDITSRKEIISNKKLKINTSKTTNEYELYFQMNFHSISFCLLPFFTCAYIVCGGGWGHSQGRRSKSRILIFSLLLLL